MAEAAKRDGRGELSTKAATSDEGVAFLSPTMPPVLATSVGWLLILVFFAAVAAAIFLELPETVRAPFTLIPPEGTDPIQSPVEGRVVRVGVEEGRRVDNGQELFAIQSDKIQGWTTELLTLEQELRSVSDRIALREQTYEAAVRLQKATIGLHATQAEHHRREIAERQELIGRMSKLGSEGLIRGLDVNRDKIDLAQTQREEATSRRSLGLASARLKTMEAEHQEANGRDEAERERLKVRIEALKQQVADSSKGAIVVRAPFEGIVLSVARKREGDVVEFGQELCQLARADNVPVAELTLPEETMARVRAGQRAKLFFTAFPYQRFGTLSGTLRWASPASVDSGEQDERFVATVELDSSTFKVHGRPREVQVGMKGEARVFVGSRTVIEYALEPIRALREDFTPVSESGGEGGSANE